MKFLKIILSTIAILIAVHLLFIKPRLSIANGYAARYFCSCYFGAERPAEDIFGRELNYSVAKYSQVKIEEEFKAVDASIFGLASRRAQYFPGLGCILDSGEKGIKPNLQKKNLKESENTFVFQDSIIAKPVIFKLESHLDSCFDEHTASIIVLKDDRIIYERYAEGITVHTPLLGWSMTKSWAMALVAMRIQDGKLDLNDQNLFPEWENDPKLSTVTLRNLLNAESGIKWAEKYGSLSSVNRMLFENDDAVKYVLNLPAANNPGEKFNYSSGETTLIGAVLRSSFDSYQDYYDYFYKRLSGPLGFENAWVETDEVGNMLLSSYGFATTRDWLRFGRLFLNDGIWEGKRIIEPQFIQLSSETTSNSGFEYGAHFWAEKGGELPDAPRDMYSCNGHRGQRVFILPSQNMVVVRMGWKDADFNHLLSGVINVIYD